MCWVTAGSVAEFVYTLFTNPAVLWWGIMSVGISGLFMWNRSVMERALRESREGKLTASMENLTKRLKAMEKKLKVIQGAGAEK